MIERTAEPGTAQAYIERRRARLLAGLPRAAQPVAAGAHPLAPERLQHLLHHAEELFWNELAWEELTDEEVIPGGHLTELVFAAFLAFVDGLLLDEASARSDHPARPRPEAVEELLSFLGERYAAFSAEIEAGADSEKLVWARKMTAELIGLVLCRLYQVTPSECEQLDVLD